MDADNDVAKTSDGASGDDSIHFIRPDPPSDPPADLSPAVESTKVKSDQQLVSQDPPSAAPSATSTTTEVRTNSSKRDLKKKDIIDSNTPSFHSDQVISLRQRLEEAISSDNKVGSTSASDAKPDRKLSKKESLELSDVGSAEDDHRNHSSNSRMPANYQDQFGVSDMTNVTFDLGGKSYTLDEGGSFTSGTTDRLTSASTLRTAGASFDVRRSYTLDGEDEEDGGEGHTPKSGNKRNKDPKVAEGKSGEEDDAASQHSHGSRASIGSVQSAFSEKIQKAARRGAERAQASTTSMDGSSSRKHRKKKHKKKKKSDRQRERIRNLVEESANKAAKVQFTNIPKNEDLEVESSPLSLPDTADILSESDFTSLGLNRLPSGDRSISSMMSHSSVQADGDESLGNVSSKYNNESYLQAAAASKFQKGLHCTKRKRYSMARSKFRAALKARILLHEDIQHISIAPVHEMIGLVERKLGNYEKSRLHLMAALEICEGALEQLATQEKSILEEKNGGGGEANDEGGGAAKLGVPDLRETVGSSNSHVGTVDMTKLDPAMAQIQEQRQILLTNIARIKKTIDIVKKDALKKQRKEQFAMPNYKVSPVEERDDESTISGSMSNQAAAKPVAAKAGKVSEEDTVKAWTETLDKPGVITKTPEQLVMDAMQQQQQEEEEQQEEEQQEQHAPPPQIGQSEKSSSTDAEISSAPVDNEMDQQPDEESEQPVKEMQSESSEQSDDQVVDEMLDDDNSGDSEEEIHQAEILNRRQSLVSWALDSIVEEKGSHDAGDEEKKIGSAPDDDEDNDDDESDGPPLTQIIPQEPEARRPGLQRGGPSLVKQRRFKRISVHNEKRLRTTYHTQSAKGEEYYDLKQYSMAIPCFNDAKFALLIISGMPEDKLLREDPREIEYAKLRDQINSALLSERITDCHVEKFFREGFQSEDRDSDDYSHVNYRQTAVMLSQSSKDLRDLIDKYTEENMGNDTEDSYIRDFKELVTEATFSLARVYSKQGCVYAKLNSHLMALDLFGDSIAAWEEAANLKVGDSGDSQNLNDDIPATNSDALIVETSRILNGFYESNKTLSKHSSPDKSSLRNMTDIIALSTVFSMASSYHALGASVLVEEDMEESSRFVVAIDHHINALKFTSEAQRLIEAASLADNLSTLGAAREEKASVGHVMNMATRGRDLSVLTPGNSKEAIGNSPMEKCSSLETQQQICISHAAFMLGLKDLSNKWLHKAMDSARDLNLTGAVSHIEVALYIQTVLEMRGSEKNSEDLFPFYEGGVSVVSSEFDDQSRMGLHYGMAALEKGYYQDAMNTFRQNASQLISSSPAQAPEYHAELLHAIDAQIIIEVKEGNMDGAMIHMNRRLDLVSKWIGYRSVAMANNLHRISCLHSILGHHKQCIEKLEESISVGAKLDGYNALSSMKLLATTHDVLNDNIDKAVRGYEVLLSKTPAPLSRARLMNALAHLHLKAGGQNQMAIEYLEKSLNLQQDAAKSGSDDIDLMIDTMILNGNVLASKHSYSQAIYWFESALNSNPNKSPIHPGNLRAWYNKGVTLFRSGDIIGAGHAFGIILDELDMTLTAVRGSSFVLSAVGGIYFANKDYEGAIQRFEESLLLNDDDLTSFQRAGVMCNIATAFYRLKKFDESEATFLQAIEVARSSGPEGDGSLDILANIMSKFAYILYKRNLYLRAYNLYSDASSVASGSGHLDDFSDQCKEYAEFCRLRLQEDSDDEDSLPEQQSLSAQRPRFQAGLIPITDGQNATRYSDAVFSPEHKLLTALGVESSHSGAATFTSEDTKAVCKAAIDYLISESEGYRTEFANKFEGMLARKLTIEFDCTKTCLERKLETSET